MLPLVTRLGRYIKSPYCALNLTLEIFECSDHILLCYEYSEAV